MKNGEKVADQQQTSRSKKKHQHTGKFPGFSFHFTIPRLGADVAGNPVHKQTKTKKVPKILLCLVKRLGNLERLKTDNNTSIPAKQHKIKEQPHSHHASQGQEEPGLLPSEGYNQVSQHSHWGGISESKTGSQDFHPH